MVASPQSFPASLPNPFQRSLLAVGAPAVDLTAPFERLELDAHSWVDVSRGWLQGADTLLDELTVDVPWCQGTRRMYDRVLDEPRLSRWYRGTEVPSPALADVRSAVQHRYRVPVGGVGLNYYRDGRDSVAWHADRELRRLDRTLVAIVTLGAQRPFLVRRRGGGPSIDLRPASGDLLVMGGATQRDWEHCVPKVASCGPRISASVRWTAREGAPVAPSRSRGPGRPAR